MLAAALPLAAFVRNQRSSGRPLFVAEPHAIAYRIHSGTAAGLCNRDGGLTIAADSTPTAALLAAFQTWSRIEGSSVAFLDPVPEADGTARTDSVNLITFADTPSNRALTFGAIAVTRLFSETDGALADTDVIFNPEMPFSTTLEEGTFDIQGALTHELGHALGLDHSGSATATMFATTTRGSARLRSLSDDDRAFVRDVYPSETPRDVGTIEGVVRSPGGGVIIGAIVTAFDPERNIAVSGISEANGTFRIPQLPPGNYRLIAEPLDGPAEPFQMSFPRRNANTNFRTLVSVFTTAVAANEIAQVELAIEAGAPAYNLRGLGAARPGSEPETRAGAVLERGGIYEVSVHGEGLDDPAIALESLQILGTGVEILATPLERGRVGFGNGDDFPSLHFTVRVAGDTPLGLASLLLQTASGDAAFTSGFEVVTARAVPRFTSAGVVNAATFLDGPIAPGSLLSIFGTDLAATAEGARLDPVTGRVADLLGGVSVRFNGAPAPLLFVSSGQVNVQAPADLPLGQVVVTLDRDGVRSGPAVVEAVPAAPGLFAHPAGGALALHPDGSLNGPENPAPRGSFVSLFGVGAGAVSPALESGELAAPAPLSLVDSSVAATVGGLPAQVTFAGMAPGFAGLLQVNIRIPEDAPVGDATPLLVRIGGAAAPISTIAIR